MPLASVDAVQLTRMAVADCAVAVTPEGTVGAVISAGGWAGALGGGGAESEPPPPPQADNTKPSDTNVASAGFRFMRLPAAFAFEFWWRRTLPRPHRQRRQTRAIRSVQSRPIRVGIVPVAVRPGR